MGGKFTTPRPGEVFPSLKELNYRDGEDRDDDDDEDGLRSSFQHMKSVFQTTNR